MLLDTTTRSIELLLGAAVTTNQLKITASWVDMTATTQSPATTTSSSNNTTPVTIVASPAASTQRKVMEVTIFNADTVSATVTVRVNDSSSLFPIVTFSIPTGQTLQYTDTLGWGLIASTVSIGPAGPTGATGHGSTTTTAAPSASGGNWIFALADTTAFSAVGLPIYCSDGTNSIRGHVVSVASSTQLTVAPDSTSGTVSSIANGSTFTFSGVQGPAGGGGGGAMTKIAQVVCSGSQSVVTFSSIPSTYTDLIIMLLARATGAVSFSVVRIKFNNDGTTANYLNEHDIYSSGTTVSAEDQAPTSNGLPNFYVTGTGDISTPLTYGSILVPGYSNTTLQKGLLSNSGFTFSSGGVSNQIRIHNGHWLSAAAINRIDLTIASGSFLNGSVFTLYGLG